MNVEEYITYEMKAAEENGGNALAYARCTGTLSSVIQYVMRIAEDDTLSAQHRVDRIKSACDITRGAYNA